MDNSRTWLASLWNNGLLGSNPEARFMVEKLIKMKELTYQAHGKLFVAHVDFGDNIRQIQFEGHVTETKNGVTEVLCYCRSARDAKALALLLNVADAGLGE